MNSKEKDAIREMMQTEGWRLFVAYLKERENAWMEALVFADIKTVEQTQAYIKAFRETRMTPKTLLEGGPDEKEG